MADVVAFGELLVDFVPAAGPQSLVTAEIFKKAAGGAPANVDERSDSDRHLLRRYALHDPL